MLLETLITIFAFHGFWTGVKHGGNLSSIIAVGIGGKQLVPDPLWSFMAIAPLTGLGGSYKSLSKGVKLIIVVSSLTHGFFCWRIWAVRPSMIIPSLVMIVSVLTALSDANTGSLPGFVVAICDGDLRGRGGKDPSQSHVFVLLKRFQYGLVPDL